MSTTPTTSAFDGLAHVVTDVADERVRQHEKWGEQNYPDVHPLTVHTTNDGERMAGFYEIPTAARAKFLCQNANPDTWAAVLVEEVAEAVEAATIGTTAELRTELVQVAAVAVNWVQAIDRRERQNGDAA
jgi:hypothetical protein